VLQQRQRDIAGVVEAAQTERDIHRVAEHVGHLVGQLQVQLQPRVRGAEGGQPRQQHVAAQVRGGGHLQRAAQFGIFALRAGLAFAQCRQHLLRVRQVQRALGGQAQAAGGAHEQPQVQLALQPRHRRRHLSRQQIRLAGRAGKAAQRGGAAEQVQVVDTDHFHSSSESDA